MTSLRSKPHSLFPIIAIVFATFLVMLGMSIDSPTHDVTGHIDSSWYMMCGRAWMNGLTPYVDFTDSKGPLLWLIYGIGYLISPCNYQGVFLLSCLSFITTSFIVYRTAHLLVTNKYIALWVAILMLLAFFHPLHYETRPEDFAQLFFVTTLYYCIRFCYTDEKITSQSFRNAMLVTGMCMGAVMMMKFTFTFMLIIMVIVMLYVAMKALHWKYLFQGGAYLLLGILLSLLPFAVYFLIKGALTQAIYQYFVVTLSTAPDKTPFFFLLHGSKTYLIITIIAGLSILPMLKQYRFVPIIIALWFYGITTINADWSYYYNSLNFLAFFPLIALGLKLNKQGITFHDSKARAISIVIIILLSVYAILWGANHRGHIIHGQTPEKIQYHMFASWVGKVPHARIAYLNCHCIPACGDPVEALPACQYWARQNNVTITMKTQQDRQVMKQKPDFVIVTLTDSEHVSMLTNLGYHQLPTHVENAPFNNKGLFTRYALE